MSNELPEWFKEFHELKTKTDRQHIELAKEISKKYNVTEEYARRKYYKYRSKMNSNIEEPEEENGTNIQDILLKTLKSEKTIDFLCDKLSVSENTLTCLITDLKNEGYNIHIIGDVVKYIKNVAPTYNNYVDEWDGSTTIKIGIVSDTHLGSKHQQLSFLEELYDTFNDEGIKYVYHSGDLTDGYYRNRPDHIFDLIPGVVGADQQSDYVIDKYPHRNGIITRFITGNHDQTHVRNGGVDIGRSIERSRPDMQYCGMSNATFELTPECKLELNHPLDGSAYAISYSLQKYIDSLAGGTKPNILINGHHHKAFSLYYRNIHAIEAGCTQAQTPFMKGKKLAAHIGGYIYEAKISKEGTIKRQKTEFLPLYTPIQNDY